MRDERRTVAPAVDSALIPPPSALYLYSARMKQLRRIAILTGGGDCPGLTAVIRAAVRTAMRDHNLEVLGVQLGFEGLINRSVVSMTGDLIRGILPKGGTLLRTTNRGNPFEYPAGNECVDRSLEVLKNL